MRSTKKILRVLLFAMPVLFGTAVFGDDIDDTLPDVTARVARISVIRGDVQIRREGSQDWEKAVLNLPIVEGDELTTDSGGRFEIQFNNYTHVRVAENSYLKIIGLKDEAIALSLPEGTLNASLTRFDKEKGFFEIDAPKTTIAVQKSGTYRVDAGKPGDDQVRVSITNNGEARVYSETSGFTLKSGRAAIVKIDGQLAGEMETDDASRFTDEFDGWALDRDLAIAKRLKDAYFDKYYDRDIYGADDLNDYGEWVHTKKYGFVWRPYRSSISQYVNWSPYRYGHWRWVPPYGWTWINDEPWGWATYHHGRWVYDNGFWYWTPYGMIRTSRSWWAPALVGMIIVNHNICWYPLPHNYGYYNYNYYYGNYGGGPRRGRHNNGGNWQNNGGGNQGGGGHQGGGGGSGGPTPSPTPAGPVSFPTGGPSVFASNTDRRAWFATPPHLRVPPGGVVSTPLSSFGRDNKGIGFATTRDAKDTLANAPELNDPVRLLPTRRDLDGKISTQIRVENPRIARSDVKAQTGAQIRNADGPLDQKLQTTRILGDRQPVQIRAEPAGSGEPRKTGAVTRQLPDQNTQIRVEPQREGRTPKPVGDDPIRAEPTFTPPVRQKDDRPSEPVRQPRSDPPPRTTDPVRAEPTRRSDPPPTRSEPTRSEPTRRSDPPPAKSDPPPSKSEPSKSEPTRKPKDT